LNVITKAQLLKPIFFVILAFDLLAIITQHEEWRYVSKPLLVLSLLGYFLNETDGMTGGLRTWMILALLLSWAGDVLLLFEARNDLFFLLGLGSFLLAHTCYIIFFHLIRLKEGIPGKLWPLLIVAVYYTALIYLLSPHLGDMKLPVRIYAIVISFMFMLAMHMIYLPAKKTGQWMLLGALLFVLSDSILAIDRFYYSFSPAGWLVMLTYGAAQFALVVGGIKYLKNLKP